MTDDSIGTWRARARRIDASSPADLIDVLDRQLSEADALRLGRVLRALADAGLIHECHVFVRAGELSGADG
jgi:hypothetical protein